jgi:hypothetical protein
MHNIKKIRDFILLPINFAQEVINRGYLYIFLGLVFNKTDVMDQVLK